MATAKRWPGGGDSTLTYPGCVGSNGKEMCPFLALREVNSVLLNGCVFRRFASLWVISPISVYPYGCFSRGI